MSEPTTNSDPISTRLVVRDHDDECEHGFKYSHGWTTPRPGTPPRDFQRFNKGGGDRWTDHHRCPGGRERTFEPLEAASSSGQITVREGMWVEVAE